MEQEHQCRSGLAEERELWDSERNRLRATLRSETVRYEEQVRELETALSAKSAECVETQADTLSLLTAAKGKIAELKQAQEEQLAAFSKKEKEWHLQGERVAELARDASAAAEERIQRAAEEATKRAEEKAREAEKGGKSK